MFKENGSLQYIEVDAQDVVAMFRSTSTVMIAHGGNEKQPCEAFVCVVQNGSHQTAYVALSLQNRKSFVIFTPQSQPTDKDTSDAAISEALDFVRERGFDMQSINLSYSKALKEVVLNDLRVVRSVSGGKKSLQKKAQTEKPVKTTTPAAGKNGKAAGGEADTPQPSTSKTADGTHGPNERLAGAVSPDESMLASVRAEKERLTDEKKKAEIAAGEELARLQAEIAAVTKEMVSATSAINSEIASATTELKRLSVLKADQQSAADKEMASLARQVEGLTEEITSTERDNTLRIQDLRNAIEKLSAEKLDLEKRGAEQFADGQAELKRLQGEKDSAQKKRDEEIASLRLELESLSARQESDTNLEELRKEVERLASEKTDAEKARIAESSALRDQRARLETEAKQSAHEGERELSILRSEIERLHQEKTSKDQKVLDEVTSLRAELAQLHEEKENSEEAAVAELSTLKSEWEHLVQEKSRLGEEMPGEIARLKSEIELVSREKNAVEQSLAGEISELKRTFERLTAEKEELEKASEEEQALLRNSVRKLEEEISAHSILSTSQRNELRSEIDVLATRRTLEQEDTAAEMSSLTAERARLQKESCEAGEKAAHEIKSLKDEISRISKELIADQKHHAAELGVLQAEAERLSREKESRKESAAEELEAARTVIARLRAEVAEVEESNAERVAALCSDAERLMQEREDAEQKAAATVFAAREKIELLASELLHSGNAIMESISATYTAILGGWKGFSADDAAVECAATVPDDRPSVHNGTAPASEEKSVEEDAVLLELLETADEEFPVLSEDTDLDEPIAAEEEAVLIADAAELSQALEEVTPVPVSDKACLSGGNDRQGEGKPAEKSESRSDASQRSHVVAPVSVEAATHDAVIEETVRPEQDAADPFAFLNCEGPQTGIVSSLADTAAGSSGPPVQFAKDTTIASVEYREPNDIVEIYQSLNRTRVAMEDHTTVTCDAYLCGVRKDGRYYVYVALYVTDAKGILIYSPDTQPEDAESYVKILRDGMNFVEIVGFMMDGVDLGGNEAQRIKALNKIPVLCKV